MNYFCRQLFSGQGISPFICQFSLLFLVRVPVTLKLATIFVLQSPRTLPLPIDHVSNINIAIFIGQFALSIWLILEPFSFVHTAIEEDQTTFSTVKTIFPVPFVNISKGIDHSSSSFVLLILPLSQVDVSLKISTLLAIFTTAALACRFIIDKQIELIPIFVGFFCGLDVHFCWQESWKGRVFVY